MLAWQADAVSQRYIVCLVVLPLEDGIPLSGIPESQAPMTLDGWVVRDQNGVRIRTTNTLEYHLVLLLPVKHW